MATNEASLRLRCSCGVLFDVPEKLAGKRIQCKRCNHVITVPVPASLEGVVDVEGGSEPAQPAELVRRQAGGFQWKWVFAGPLVLWGLLAIANIALVVGSRALLAAKPELFAKVQDFLTSPDHRMLLAYAVPAVFFAIGGAIIAWQSEGRTIAEPFIATILAVGVPVLVLYLKPDLAAHVLGTGAEGAVRAIDPKLYGVPAAALVASIVGAFVGEALPGAD